MSKRQERYDHMTLAMSLSVVVPRSPDECIIGTGMPAYAVDHREIVFVRDMEREQAMKEIRALLGTSPSLDELEISAQLGIDFRTVCACCDALVKTGMIQRSNV
jgi:hypothetical protein